MFPQLKKRIIKPVQDAVSAAWWALGIAILALIMAVARAH